MTLLAKIRSRHLPLARALIALFAVGWLGLALQPCQAAALGDQGPASHHEGMEHESMPEGCDTPCPHCPSAGPDGCETGVALDCESIGVPALPSKEVEAPALDAFAWLAPAALPPIDLEFRDVAPDWTDAGRERASPVSLQKRYCTYLK